jgi:hypothetical protein
MDVKTQTRIAEFPSILERFDSLPAAIRERCRKSEINDKEITELWEMYSTGYAFVALAQLSKWEARYRAFQENHKKAVDYILKEQK